MKLSCLFAVFLVALTLFSGLCAAQNVKVDVSACHTMFHVLEAMKSGVSETQISSQLDSVLETRPYQIMFRHYNRSWRPNHLPVSVFKRMIMSLRFEDAYSKGENQRADQMLPYWMRFYNHLDLYRQNLRQLDNTDLTTLINGAVRYAQDWLPPEWHIPDFYISILPNGGSVAFAIDTTQGYDFFQLPRDSSGNISWNDLLVTISHESHHLGMKTPPQWTMSASDSVAYQFLSLFVGEGTATKFISDYPGGCVSVIDEARRDSSFAKSEQGKWWQKYTSEEPDLFVRFVETFNRAYSGKLSASQLQTEMGQFWLSGYVSPVYFVGAELFGVIYRGHGKEGVFKAMRDPRQILPLYRNAMDSRPELSQHCYAIPDQPYVQLL